MMILITRIGILTTRALFTLSSNKKLYQVEDKDRDRTVMAMRELVLIEDAAELKNEKEEIMRRDPALGVIISDRESYHFLKLLMEVSEEHYDDEYLFTMPWLRKNLQNIHGGVRANFIIL
jgi:hypothetical protein